MKLITGILLAMMVAGGAWAQNPDIIQNTKNTMNAVAKKAEMEQNAALQAAGLPSKPAAGTAAKAVTASSAAKSAPVHLKPVSAAKNAASGPAKQAATSAPANKIASQSAKKPAPTKIAVAAVKPQPKQGAQKTAHPAGTPFAKAQKSEQDKTERPVQAAAPVKPESTPMPESAKEKKTISAEGRRDPFISPVVSRANGPACSTGKRCLAIDQILVRGVVKADAGMIAVVVNSLNKAYFLKENDPVYNGYVLRITGDSVVFKETYQDRLGKELTREVVKKITTPAV
jgi:hypothetical protein